MDVRPRLRALFAAAHLLAWWPACADGLVVRPELRPPLQAAIGEIVVRYEGPTEREEAFSLAGVAALPATAAGGVVTCRGEGLWCPRLTLTGDGMELPVFAAVVVEAEVTGPGGETPPPAGSVQLVVRDGSGGEPIEVREPLAVIDGKLSFVVPRSVLDLRFAFPGAAPLYRWGVAPPGVDEAPKVRLGILRLRAGGSISGWARSLTHDVPLAGARIVASPVTAPGEGGRPPREWQALSDRGGFFQVDGLPGGTFRLELRAEEHSSSVLEAIDVDAGSETALGTVLLRAPVRVSVEITPPRHPNGSRWTISGRPVRPLSHEEPVEAEASEEGVAVLALRPGEHNVKVLAASGETYHFETRPVVGDEWWSIAVPILKVEGSVSLGGEPVAATVTVRTGAGDRAELTSDEDGELSGWMRRPERAWLMADVSWREGEERRQRTIEVFPRVGAEKAELTIDLPAGTVYGEVVDAEGRRQAGIRVVASPAEGASRFTEVRGETDAAGRFRLTGLEATRYLLQAGGLGGATSEAVAVDLSSDLPIGEVRLVVWPTRQVTVRVTADEQPIPSANLTIDGFGRTPVSLAKNTGPDGTVTFAVPEDLQRAVITLFAPSHLLWSGCVPLEGEHLSLALPALPSGTLTVTDVGRQDLPPLLDGQTVLLTGDGGAIPLGVLLNWNRLRQAERRVEIDGDRATQVIRLPALPAGSYALAWSGAPRWELALRACTGAFPNAEWVALPPGGEAELTIDGSEQQERRFRESRRH